MPNNYIPRPRVGTTTRMVLDNFRNSAGVPSTYSGIPQWEISDPDVARVSSMAADGRSAHIDWLTTGTVTITCSGPPTNGANMTPKTRSYEPQVDADDHDRDEQELPTD